MMDEAHDSRRLDEEDLRRFLGDPDGEAGREAAACLFRRHQDKVYLWCYRYVRDHDRALDLAQDVMLSAFRKLPGYVHRAKFTSWLFIIARNRCLSELRRPDIMKVVDMDPDQLQSRAANQTQEMDVQDLWRRLAEHLDDRELDVLHMRCVEGLPVDSITEILGLDTATGARGVLQRIRRKLRGVKDDVHGLREGFAHD